jgi:hypothetical protein
MVTRYFLGFSQKEFSLKKYVPFGHPMQTKTGFEMV